MTMGIRLGCGCCLWTRRGALDREPEQAQGGVEPVYGEPGG